MDISLRFQQALTADLPALRLREEVQILLNDGYDRQELLTHLEALRHHLHTANRDADEDVVLEVMDFVTGWCSPTMLL